MLPKCYQKRAKRAKKSKNFIVCVVTLPRLKKEIGKDI